MSRWLTFASLLALLSGCSNYDFTVNEKRVYTPRELLADYSVVDPALRSCLEQAIIDQQVTRPNELLTLECTHSDVDSLEGLQLFTGLRQLSLSGNRIRDLAALEPLSSLSNLYLDNNQLIDPVPLYELLSLRVLDLSANPQLQCPGGNALFHLEALTLPTHCASR